MLRGAKANGCSAKRMKSHWTLPFRHFNRLLVMGMLSPCPAAAFRAERAPRDFG